MQATALKDGADSADVAAARAERDRRDIEIINANAAYLNAGAEENLEFQADIWEDEENAARKCSLRGRFASYADPALRAQEKDAWPRAAARAERDRCDIAWINANAERLNAEVEETLEFQADIWEDEE